MSSSDKDLNIEERAIDDQQEPIALRSFDEWLHELGSGHETDTMLRFAPSVANSIDVTHSHPSGLTQFLSGRRTRLSTLLRDRPNLGSAQRTAGALLNKIQELSADRGIDVGYLAAGLASWRSTESGAPQHMTAPVLLNQVQLSVRPYRDDYDLQLTGKARLNPALARWFETIYDIDLNVEAFQHVAYPTAKLEPLPALQLLREHSQTVRGLVVEHRMLISTFADLSDTASQQTIDPEHPVIKDLYTIQAGTEEATELTEDAESTVVPAEERTPLDERDPAEEHLVVDLDPSQQDSVDHIVSGESLVVSAPPGTGQTQTAVAAATALAAEDKRVLVVAERSSTLEEFRKRLAVEELDSIVFNVEANTSPQVLSNQIIKAMLGLEAAKEPAVNRVQDTVRDRREKLIKHLESLHSVRKRWNCSPFEAMRALGELTALNPAPTTRVRLKRSVLDATVDRQAIAEQLRNAAELGAFSQQAVQSPWYGARLRNVQEVESAQRLVEELSEQLTLVSTKLDVATEYSQLRKGQTVKEWVEQVELLEKVRILLDSFAPDVFDRPVDDLIAATAPRVVRRNDPSMEMGTVTRSRMRKVARDYVRPGVTVNDLYESLKDVQEQRIIWNKWTTSKRHPQIPTGVKELAEQTKKLSEKLQQLQNILATPASEKEHLDALPVDDVHTILDHLVADSDTLHTLPERTLVLDQLKEQGLGELLEDFQSREVPASQVEPELDVAWWQSALEAMMSGDEHLTMMDGAELKKIEAEYRLADAAHLDLGPAKLRWRLANTWRQRTIELGKTAEELRVLMREGEPTTENLAEIDPRLLKPLLPIWTTSPLALAEIDPRITFDTVILLDSETLALSAGLGAISRAEQVVAFGDSVSGRPRGFQVSVDPTARAKEPRQAVSVHAALLSVLPVKPLTTMHRGVSQKLTRFLGEQLYDGDLDRMPIAEEFTGQPTDRGVEVEYTTEPGVPGFGDDGVESTTVEVTRTVDVVFEQFRNNPRRSVAVITATEMHARRVAEALRVNLANERWATSFFTADAPHGEPFVVVPMERAHGLVRDTVIFTLGYGRTSTGSIVHHFGPLSEAHGVEYYATVMTRARRYMRILTCLHPEEIEPARVAGGARYFWELLAGLKTGTGFAPAPGQNGFEPDADTDPLTTDIAVQLDQSGAVISTDERARCDMAIWNPHPVQLADGTVEFERNQPVAILTDASELYRSMSVRERSRLRPQAFEKLGWRSETLWTIDAFVQPQQVTEHYADMIGLHPELES